MYKYSKSVAYVLLIDEGYYAGNNDLELPVVVPELKNAKLHRYHEVMRSFHWFREKYNKDRLYKIEIRQIS